MLSLFHSSLQLNPLSYSFLHPHSLSPCESFHCLSPLSFLPNINPHSPLICPLLYSSMFHSPPFFTPSFLSLFHPSATSSPPSFPNPLSSLSPLSLLSISQPPGNFPSLLPPSSYCKRTSRFSALSSAHSLLPSALLTSSYLPPLP